MSLKGKRILIAKPGLDGHDVGAKVIAMALRDAGAEVIYTGLRKAPEAIARVAVEEDMDAVGLSILTGSHKELATDTIRCLGDLGADDMPVFVGGTIPAQDVSDMKQAGVRDVFTAAMTIDDVVAREPAALRVHFDLAVVHARANLRAGLLFLRENAVTAAAEALQESLAGQVRYAEAHNNLGVAYEREGRYGEAEEDARTLTW